jgi:hypothetical protein
MTMEKLNDILRYPMDIKLTTASVKVCTETKNNDYVIYNGQIAGVSNRVSSEGHTEVLDRRANEIQLNRD